MEVILIEPMIMMMLTTFGLVDLFCDESSVRNDSCFSSGEL